MKALAFLLLMTTAAPAQLVCLPMGKMVAGLEGGTIKEQSRGAGVFNSMVARLFVNSKTGTWSMVIFRPDGLACIAMAGDGWQWSKEELPRKPSKSL